MRRPSVYNDRRGTLEVKMTPMIDVVFLLLVFFVWTASFQVVENIVPTGISEEVATTSAGTEDEPKPEDDLRDFKLVVRIHWTDQAGPSWEINDVPQAGLDDIAGEFDSKPALYRSEQAVIIHPDSNVPLGHVFDVFDMARLKNYDNVQFATSQKP